MSLRKDQQKLIHGEGMDVEIRELRCGGPASTKEHAKNGPAEGIIEEVVRMEKRMFPKHESMASTLHAQISKRNSGLLYAVATPQSSQPIVGYVMFSWPSCLLASITKLAVRESHRRRGIGEALMRAAIEKCKAKKIERISLHVDPLRTQALSLYQKLGFSVDASVSSYYSQDRHAYRMFLDLS